MDLAKELGRRIPFATHLGIRLKEKGGGRAVLELDLRPELMNSWDSAHGGVVMTLLDVAMAVAARTLDEKAVGAITVEMKVSFIGTCQGTLVAEGRCIHRGKSLAFCEGEARDAAGKLAAKASGTFMLRHQRSTQAA
jgi:uncharacterized protein (TIGR00369 family)